MHVMPHASIRATAEEQTKPLPGDEVISAPTSGVTHGITIHRPPQDVWPWLAQMGADRAGWYSYDALDNGGRPSAERILPELQTLAKGAIFPALPGARDGFTLVGFEPDRYLILSWILPDGTYMMTWAFVLERLDPESTRLVVRARVGSGYTFQGLPKWLSTIVGRPVHFVMERKMLLGLARRAETLAA
jgi:hypothetical protein